MAPVDPPSPRRLLTGGKGYTAKLEANGLYTMGDIAQCSIGKPTDRHNEELHYRLFGVNAEQLIDHAWGWEPCTIVDMKAYKPERKSIVSGQVLQCPYTSSAIDLLKVATALYDRIVGPDLLVRRLSISANKLLDEASVQAERLELFTDYAEKERRE